MTAAGTTPPAKELKLRRDVIATAKKMSAMGLVHGRAGNVSARYGDGCLITPSGLDYAVLRPPDIVCLERTGVAEGERLPSTEWRFHLDVLAARPEVNAVIHTHSMFATVLACLEREIPSFHYMIAAAGGTNVRCAPYATFGTKKLSRKAVKALEDRTACLLSHHGLIALGASLCEALDLAVEVERLAEEYWRILQTGKPKLLTDAEMKAVLEKFKTYGRQPAHFRQGFVGK